MNENEFRKEFLKMRGSRQNDIIYAVNCKVPKNEFDFKTECESMFFDRLMKQAEKFHRPIICFVDTPGAFCGMEAEERGQGEAIARNLYEMSSLETPILSVLIGEGGSGGALAMAVADEVWILENAVYSILSPEGYAAILWKDGSQAARAAKAMKLTSYDLYKAGFVEKIISEPESYTLDSMMNVFDNLEENISAFLENSKKMTEKERVEARYQRFRSM